MELAPVDEHKQAALEIYASNRVCQAQTQRATDASHLQLSQTSSNICTGKQPVAVPTTPDATCAVRDWMSCLVGQGSMVAFEVGR